MCAKVRLTLFQVTILLSSPQPSPGAPLYLWFGQPPPPTFPSGRTVPALGTSMASIWNALSVSARFNHHSFTRGNATSAWGTERNRNLFLFESPAPLLLVIDSTVFLSTLRVLVSPHDPRLRTSPFLCAPPSPSLAAM
ncbi:hypothetical protein BC827DRAFT_233317 [Russula dissimulans]|nr:hypothetical protein BC827DRAFT_233317 [Russula dissimulans]